MILKIRFLYCDFPPVGHRIARPTLVCVKYKNWINFIGFLIFKIGFELDWQ